MLAQGLHQWLGDAVHGHRLFAAQAGGVQHGGDQLWWIVGEHAHGVARRHREIRRFQSQFQMVDGAGSVGRGETLVDQDFRFQRVPLVIDRPALRGAG